MNKKERWTETDELLIINNYLTKGASFIAKKTNKSINSIRVKAQRLGIINYHTKPWTNEEIKFLKNNYEIKGNKFVCDSLNRSRGSVSKKAKDLKLKVKYKPNISKEELEIAVKNSYCMSNLIKNLGKTNTGTYMKIIKKYLVLYKINISHFDPYRKNKDINKIVKKLPIEHWLKYGSNITSHNLKHKLYKLGLKKHECEKCGQGELWRGEKISLILDHIDGDSKNNVLNNLRVLCPNCNAALPTHCRGYKNNYAPIV